LGCYLKGQGHSMTLQQNRVWPITLLFEVIFFIYFTEINIILGWLVAPTNWSLHWRSRLQYDLAAKSCPAQKLKFEVPFKIILQKWSSYWDTVLQTTFWSLRWRSRSQHDLAAKTCLAHNFVIWSQILQVFDTNYHHIEINCHYLAHHLALCILYCIILSSAIYNSVVYNKKEWLEQIIMFWTNEHWNFSIY